MLLFLVAEVLDGGAGGLVSCFDVQSFAAGHWISRNMDSTPSRHTQVVPC